MDPTCTYIHELRNLESMIIMKPKPSSTAQCQSTGSLVSIPGCRTERWACDHSPEKRTKKKKVVPVKSKAFAHDQLPHFHKFHYLNIPFYYLIYKTLKAYWRLRSNYVLNIFKKFPFRERVLKMKNKGISWRTIKSTNVSPKVVF